MADQPDNLGALAAAAEDGADRRDVPLSLAQMAELGILTASLLHELRQPLFAIRASAQLGIARDDAAMREALTRILDQVDHATELVEFYGGLGLDGDDAAFDLNEPVRQGVEMLGHRCRSAGAHLVLDLAREPVVVRGRPGAARQVVVNLLHNAFDAVALHADRGARKVAVRTRVVAEEVRLVVEDSGPGVHDDIRARLFEPFFTTKDRGTGLGLYITHELVHEAAGRLEVRASTSGGAVFEVSYPRVG